MAKEIGVGDIVWYDDHDQTMSQLRGVEGEVRSFTVFNKKAWVYFKSLQATYELSMKHLHHSDPQGNKSGGGPAL